MQLILRMREKGGFTVDFTHARSASGSLGATGGSMATRRCSYTAAFKLKLVEYAERHGVRNPPRAACRSLANVRVK